jgi:hypothetical protein
VTLDVVNWDAEAYSKRIPGTASKNAKVKLLQQYSPKIYKVKGKRLTFAELRQQMFRVHFSANYSAPVTAISEPAIIFDIFGQILVWNLPGVLSDQCQKGMWLTCSLLQDTFRRMYEAAKKKEWEGKKLSMRERGFLELTGDHTTIPGTAIFSPAWFEQGHNVRLMSIFRTLSTNILLQMPYHQMHVSKKYKTRVRKVFVVEVKPYAMLLSALLSVTHPMLYEALMDVMTSVGELDDHQDAMARWLTVFSGFQMISNWMTEDHRDLSSQAEWYNVIASIGPYWNGVMKLRNLRAELGYDSGSVVVTAGRVV